MKSQEQPLISVIITTRNEELNLPACFDSLERQTLGRDSFEVIVVDNGSTDGTEAVSKGRADQFLTKGPERSTQRNYGIEMAKAPIVIYLDADMRLTEGVLEECLKALEDPAVKGIYIPETVVGEGYWIAVRRFERSFYDATAVDCVRCFRREEFLELGGFDTALCGPEDWDLDLRLGKLGRLVLIKAGLNHDEGAFDMKRYLKKKRYYGASFAAYREKWAGNGEVKKQFSLWYRFVGVFTEDGKWKKLLRHPLLATGMYALRFMVGLGFIFGKQNIRNQEVYK